MDDITRSIRTRAGDDGASDPGNGTRISKSNPVFDALGAIDELQVALGVCRARLVGGPDRFRSIATEIERAQRTCIALGGIISRIARGVTSREDALDDDVRRLEATLADWESRVPPLEGFVIAGGDLVSAELERSRVVARRAERDLVRYLETTSYRGDIIPWINALGDTLFVFARYCELEP